MLKKKNNPLKMFIGYTALGSFAVTNLFSGVGTAMASESTIPDDAFENAGYEMMQESNSEQIDIQNTVNDLLHSAAPDLSDIGGHWAEDIIKEAADKDIVNGYKDGTFKPNNPVSYVEAAKIAFETFQQDGRFEQSKYGGDQWYSKYQNFFNADESRLSDLLNIYYPNNQITRGEAMYLLIRIADPDISYERIEGKVPAGYEKLITEELDNGHILLEENLVDFKTPFLDVTLGDIYAPYIYLANELGIASGYGGRDVGGLKIFGINDKITRAEFTKMALNVKKLKDQGSLKKIEKFNGFEGSNYSGDEFLNEVKNSLKEVKLQIEKDIKIKDLSYNKTFAAYKYGKDTDKSIIENFELAKLDRIIKMVDLLPKDFMEREIKLMERKGFTKGQINSLKLEYLSYFSNSSAAFASKNNISDKDLLSGSDRSFLGNPSDQDLIDKHVTHPNSGLF